MNDIILKFVALINVWIMLLQLLDSQAHKMAQWLTDTCYIGMICGIFITLAFFIVKLVRKSKEKENI